MPALLGSMAYLKDEVVLVENGEWLDLRADKDSHQVPN